jgi:hypothetical protein
LHTYKRDSVDHHLSTHERPRRKADFGLRCLRNDVMPSVQHASPQDYQVDPALRSIPFEGGLIEADIKAREDLVERAAKFIAEWAEGNWPNKDAKEQAQAEKGDSRTQGDASPKDAAQDQ